MVDDFSTIHKVMDFLSNRLVLPSDPSSKIPYTYIDGSYNPETNTWGYGGFLDVNGKRYPMMGQGKDESKLRNVYGEIMGCMAAVKQAQSLGIRQLVVYYDYNGIEGWAAQNWKAKNPYTKLYKEFMTKACQKIKIVFQKVSSHTGVMGNEIADIMAKFAVGIVLNSTQKLLWNNLVQVSVADMQKMNQAMTNTDKSLSSEPKPKITEPVHQNIIIKENDQLKSIVCPHCHTQIDIDESDYQALIKQVRTEEFDMDVKEKVNLVKAQLEANFEVTKTEFDNQIHHLELEHEIALEKAVADKKLEVDAMKFQLLNVKNESDTQRQTFENMLRMKDEQIAYYKDFKAKQSTKMVGESLEQYCLNEFNKHRALAFRSAYFEKDNEVSKSGSKGDFIFRDTIDHIEYLSIMFEMKNESDTTVTKHKNEDFFKELDKDRKEKNCEYAVLVSMLESDNEFYNQGIADVSYRYEKMYVIRPQFFIPFITMLKNAAMHSIDIRRELLKVQQENFDVVQFMDHLEEFKAKFSRNYSLAEQRFHDAITNIDKTIDYLQKVRDALSVSTKHLSAANKQANDLTIQKLTKDSPSLLEKFKKAEPLQ